MPDEQREAPRDEVFSHHYRAPHSREPLLNVLTDPLRTNQQESGRNSPLTVAHHGADLSPWDWKLPPLAQAINSNSTECG